MIQRGNELIRINPTKKNEIEYSKNNGSSWNRRFLSGSNTGNFMDLIDYGNEILAIVKDGNEIYYSKNEGSSWNRRFLSNSNIGQFQNITSNGSELLANTNKGLYYSKNQGTSWNKK